MTDPSPSPIRGNKSGIKFSKESQTYQMFERLFLDLPEAQIPMTLSNLPKGKAINLAIGMNRCHVQWAQENGIPEELMGRSSKAIKGTTEDNWALEISLNQRRTRRGPKTSWLAELLEKVKTEIHPTSGTLPTQSIGLGAELAPSVSTQANAPVEEPEKEWVDPQDDLLANFLGGKS